jgi:flagellar motility protein MotE (MotC chaperone)
MKLALPAPRLLPMTIAAMAALLLVKSVALVRAAVPESALAGAAPAHASAVRPPQPVRPEAQMPVAAKSAPPDAAAAAMPAEPPVSDSERALLLDLRGRRAELEARDAALAARAAVVAAAEQRLAVRVDELASLQRRLEALETGRQERDEANWRGLVRLYETMKPRDAAVIFNDLDLQVLLPVLDRMKESRAAPVLAAMQPERARQVTAELAQLRTRANTPATPAPVPTEEKR